MHVAEMGVLVIGMLGGLLLLLPFYAIWTFHRRKLEEIRVQGKVQVADETQRVLEEFRKELHALRDTTTNYDVSFDNALHRIEARMSHLEAKVAASESQNVSVGYRS